MVVSMIALAAFLALAKPVAPAAPLPCRQPQLASDAHAVYLVCGADNTIYLSSSDDGGRTFRPLTRIGAVASLALGMHRGPRISIAGDALVVTAIAGKVGKGQDEDLMAWRSIDRGRTWTGPVVINDVPAAAREGLHAMAASGLTVVTAWLDLRAKGTRLYAATSMNAGESWGPDTVVYESPSGTICQCCHPSLAIAPDGTVLAMFRNVVEGHRDFYVARGTSGRFAAAEKLGTGTWALTSCPMDGGGIVTNADGAVTTVWRRDKTIFLAEPGRPEITVADGLNPAIAATPGGPVIAWNAPDGLSVAAPDRKTIVLDPAGKFVSVAASAGVVIAAWERGDQTIVHVLE